MANDHFGAKGHFIGLGKMATFFWSCKKGHFSYLAYGKWPYYHLFTKMATPLFLFMSKGPLFYFGLWQMAILSFVYGKMANFTKMANDQLLFV